MPKPQPEMHEPAEPEFGGKDPAAVKLGRKGGEARAMRLSSKRRREIARKAAAVRWGKR